MKAKLLYTVFPCLLLALTCDMGLVARSQEQDVAAVQEEQQTKEQDISYTAGVAQINDEINDETEQEEAAEGLSLAAGEAAIAQDIIDSDAAELTVLWNRDSLLFRCDKPDLALGDLQQDDKRYGK